MARTGEKLTAKRVKDFIETAPLNSMLWDTQESSLSIKQCVRGGSWRLVYYGDNRKQRVITLGKYPSMSLEVARQRAAEAKVSIFKGVDPLAQKAKAQAEAKHRETQTLKAYLDVPYTLKQSRNKSGDATIKRLRNHFSAWDKRPMHSLTRADVNKWQAEREAMELDFATIQRTYGSLQTMLNHAAKNGAIEANPLKGVVLEKPAMTDEELAEGDLRRYLEKEEVIALFAAMDAYQEDKKAKRRNSRAHGKPHLPDLDNMAYVDHVKPFLLMMFYTGFRPGDLFGLRWEHVNLRFKTITKTIEKTAHHHPEPRTFPLSTGAMDVLTTWWEQLDRPKKGYVFESNAKVGARFDRQAMQTPWKNIRSLSQKLAKEKKIKSGIPDDIVMYCLRHNFASQLIMSGADLLTVSKLMAHDDINTTIKYYGHLSPDHARDYVDAFFKTQTPIEQTETAPEQAPETLKQG